LWFIFLRKTKTGLIISSGWLFTTDRVCGRREKFGPRRIPAYVVSYFFPASKQSGLGEQPENSQKK